MPKLTGFAEVSIPGPPPMPMLGHMPRVFQFLADPIAALRTLREYGDLVGITRGCPALVCAFGRERNREVLTNPAFQHDEEFMRGPEGSPLNKLSKVLITINGDLHKRHRRLMMPAFGKSALDRYAEQIVEVSERTVEGWPLGEVVDFDALLHDVALDIALRTLFGLDGSDQTSALGHAVVEFVKVLTSPLTIMLPYNVPGTPYARTSRLGAHIIAELEQLIARKREAGATGDDAISLLIRANEQADGLSDTELVCEALTLFVAGHETIAKTLTWTMFLLERHPAILADVLDELDGVLGGRAATGADLAKLPLLERVVKESMRVLTPVPTLFLRVPQAAAELGGVMLPKGANVVVSPYATHHDPDIYPQPQRFDPARWLEFKPTIFEYLPFGAGPRMCIGASFGLLAVRLAIATILQRVRFSIVRDSDISRLTRSNIMRPKHGLPVHLQPAHRRRLVLEPIRGDIGELVLLD